ncbi:hypothetical protein GCM10022403_098060 [Streptomyces coacervatus]|uniref:Uncharacterized protein n=1 Tax=Streptomyces coacervatus TaxID=647381 RepID=A0ABP7JQ06_9ACTN
MGLVMTLTGPSPRGWDVPLAMGDERDSSTPAEGSLDLPGDANDRTESWSLASTKLRRIAQRHPREVIADSIKARAALPWTAIFVSSPNALR